VRADRCPKAFAIEYGPGAVTEPPISEVQCGTTQWWGVPNLISRLVFGIDERLMREIISSGHWNASQNDLLAIINRHALRLPCELPLREAIDWIYSSIFVTIKAMKFSSGPPVCGGPIEIAVITTDRPFRWVSHKGLYDAIATSHAWDGPAK
jgi:hypothetical protein